MSSLTRNVTVWALDTQRIRTRDRGKVTLSWFKPKTSGTCTCMHVSYVYVCFNSERNKSHALALHTYTHAHIHKNTHTHMHKSTHAHIHTCTTMHSVTFFSPRVSHTARVHCLYAVHVHKCISYYCVCAYKRLSTYPLPCDGYVAILVGTG